MGAWGTGNFANDSALDWVADLDEQQDGLAYIEQTLRFVLEETEAYVGERAMSSALAAAEVVAAMRNRPASYIPDGAEQWVKTHGEVDPQRVEPLAEQASEVARQIRDDSELRELWDADPEWLAVVDDLLARLSPPT